VEQDAVEEVVGEAADAVRAATAGHHLQVALATWVTRDLAIYMVGGVVRVAASQEERTAYSMIVANWMHWSSVFSLIIGCFSLAHLTPIFSYSIMRTY
jgi:hypothetical protein